MKIIIRNKQTSEIDIVIPNPNKYGDGKIPYIECKALKDLDTDKFEWFLTDQQIDKSDLESRRQLYVEEGSTEIKKDLAWEAVMMPDHVIKRKHIKNLNKLLEQESESETADPMKVVKLWMDVKKNSEKKASASNESPYWIEKAIEGLGRAEKDKPKIKERLEAKLAELVVNNG